MQLVTSRKKHGRYVMNPNLEDGYPFLMELFAVEIGNTGIKKNKPVYLGQVILDLSKTLMYEFHNGHISPIYQREVRLWNIDTGSIFYNIDAEDLYRDLAKAVEKGFDRSGYSKNNNKPPATRKNEKSWWKRMEKELPGKVKIAFVALMEKMIDKMLEDKHCKCTKKCVVAEGFTIDVYKTCLCDAKTKYREKMYKKQE